MRGLAHWTERLSIACRLREWRSSSRTGASILFFDRLARANIFPPDGESEDKIGRDTCRFSHPVRSCVRGRRAAGGANQSKDLGFPNVHLPPHSLLTWSSSLAACQTSRGPSSRHRKVRHGSQGQMVVEGSVAASRQRHRCVQNADRRDCDRRACIRGKGA